MRRVGTVLAVAFCAEVLSSQPAGTAQDPPVFRVDVDAIEIDAFVTDAQGNPVTDLTLDDFELLEDGTPQTIASVSLVNLPIARGALPPASRPAIDPDAYTNTAPEGRLYLIAFDSVPADLALRTRHFLRRFLEQHFAANDVAAIVYVSRGRAVDTQDFTSNRRLLLQALDKYGGGSGGSVRDRMRQLRELMEFMARLKGRRKTMIYITGGLGDVRDVLEYNGGTRMLEYEDFHAAIAAATRGNVSIYPIDPAGLTPGGQLGEGEDASFGGSLAGNRGELVRTSDLRALAEVTGGFALVNSNSFEQTFSRIVRENSTYYVLGFTSTHDRRDGRYRKLQVRVKRPGLQVRSRDGYLAPTPRNMGPPAPVPSKVVVRPVAEALGLPIASRALPMAVTAAAYKGSGRNANVAMVVELKTPVDGEIDVATVAISAAGKVFEGQHHRVKLTQQPGFRVLLEMALPPGRYQLRAAAGHVNGTTAGSVMADLDVPDFTKGPIVMSHLALTSSRVGDLVTAAPTAVLRVGLPPPTAHRQFRRGDALSIYAEVYTNVKNRVPQSVMLKAELQGDDGRVLHTVAEERPAKDAAGTPDGYGFRVALPLDVEPGSYVVHVEAHAGRTTATRQVPFTVTAD